PQVSPEEKQCLATLVNVNSINTWTLWDSDSTTMGITPQFAQVVNIKVNKLMDPHMLQLGMVGSRSSVKFGAIVEIDIGTTHTRTYVDIANFDCYNMIIGTPFMHNHNVVLDLAKNKKRQQYQRSQMRNRLRNHYSTTPQSKHLNIPNLRKQWFKEFKDVMKGPPDELPLFREVNHKIRLIDKNKRYHYYSPQCPHSLCSEFHQKLNQYINTKWWEPQSVDQAAPLLCIPKKDRQLRTVTNSWQCNDNTIQDVTPLPDQEVIREDVFFIFLFFKSAFIETVAMITNGCTKAVPKSETYQTETLN
ncbi:hypothetical protein P691DRAFT_686537, partial [Macrolepiota fuliginosa MF-IS2]